MSMFANPQEHAENPPETWLTVKVGDRSWHLMDKDKSATIGYFTTKSGAEQAKVSGFEARLYEMERRWYAGEEVRGWKPYAEVCR